MFYKDKSRYTGVSSYCKNCNKRKSKERRERNIEQARMNNRNIYYQRHEYYKTKARDYYWNNREERLKYLKEWRKNNKKESDRRYLETENGRNIHNECSKRSKAKRKRDLKWIKLMVNPFPKNIKVHYHHINNWFVIPLPERIHIMNNGVSIDEHRNKCNIWIEKLYGIKVNKLFDEVMTYS